MSIEFEQVVNQPSLYLNGMLISNDATTPNTVIDIAAGQCRDSLNQSDIILGNYLGQLSSSNPNAVTLLNFAVNGLNGLDTGSIAASTLYYIYVIADPSGFKPAGVIASTAIPSVGPLMPFGYGLQRWIGCVASDGSSHILLQYMSSANGGGRVVMYDAPQATAVTAGAATSYTAVDLSKFVPLINNTPVYIQYNLNANAAADTLKMQPVNGTGDAITVIAQAAGGTAHLEGVAYLLSQISSSKIEINYKVSAGTDAVALNVCGYSVSL